MRSPQSLLVPLLALVVIGLALVVAHLWITARIQGAEPATVLLIVRRTLAAGLVVFTAGMVLDRAVPRARRMAVLQPRNAGRWSPSGPVSWPTPGDSWLACPQRRTGPSRRPAHPRCVAWVWSCCGFSWSRPCFGPLPPSRNGPAAAWPGRPRVTSTAANRHPRHQGAAVPIRPGRQGERLVPTTEGQTFHYPLPEPSPAHQGNNRMFLVPPTPGRRATLVLVVPLDDSVRVRFQFQNDRALIGISRCGRCLAHPTGPRPRWRRRAGSAIPARLPPGCDSA